MKICMSPRKMSIVRRRLFPLVVAVLAVCFLTIGPTARPASAFIDVPDYGSTGWQNFGIQFASPFFTGIVRFVVSDEGDNGGTSWLLIDHIHVQTAGGDTLYSFETGDLTGFTLFGAGGAVGASAYSTPTYFPTDGSWMAEINTDGNVLTGDFGYGGTDGSILLLYLQGVSAISFDWNFAAPDYDPFNDFSLAVFEWEAGAQDRDIYELGRICCGQQQPVIPEPSTILLLGAGLAGLGLWGRKRMKKA